MGKLKLDLENVRVESFETSEQETPQGTVQGHISVGVSCYATDCCSDLTDCCPADTSHCSQQFTACCNTGITCPGGNTCAGTCHTGVCICL
jgi:hypothetical protein